MDICRDASDRLEGRTCHAIGVCTDLSDRLTAFDETTAVEAAELYSGPGWGCCTQDNLPTWRQGSVAGIKRPQHGDAGTCRPACPGHTVVDIV